MIESIHSLETEQHCLGGLFNNSDILPEIDFFVKESDFYEKIHQTIFLVLRGMLLAGERVDAVLLANKIISFGTKHYGDLSIFEYIEILSYKKPTKEATIESFKQLIGYRIRRDAIEKLRSMAKIVQKPGEISTSQLIEKLDQTYGDWSNSVLKTHSKPTIEICEGIESLIEGTRNNPPKESDVLLGPFPTVNSIIGSLSRPGNITVVGARSGAGKSSLSMFYQVNLAVKYNRPIIWMDSGEMRPEELRFRAVCMLTKGAVPLWALESGEWAKNEEWSILTREAIKTAKKIKIYYEQVSGLKATDIITILRRYYYKLGKSNEFLVCFDYLKALDGENTRTTEWAAMGSFIQDIKTFITDEIPLPFWTSLQLNRSGIVTNKKSDEIADNEGAFSISDRILQQSSHSVLLRFKTDDEIAEENGQFGNMKMHFLKTRFLGKEHRLVNKPIKLPNGKYARNYINVNHESFWFDDKGSLLDMTIKMKNMYKISKPNESETGEIV
jgi:replicative DNA helicase